MQYPECSAVSQPHHPPAQKPGKTPRDQLAVFEIETDYCLQILLRILGLMTRDATIPVTVAFTRTEEAMFIVIELDHVTNERCAHLRDRIGEMPVVRRAALSSSPNSRCAGATAA